MKRNATGAVLALLAVLACSACGGFLLNGISSGSATAVPTITEAIPAAPAPPAALQQLPIRRHGVGTESLGVFAMTHGDLYIAATCLGKGTFGVWFNRPELGMSGACPNSRHEAAIQTISSGVSEHRARIDVVAPAGMKWTVVVFLGPRSSTRPDDPTNLWP